jgi:MinD-like ATPase involved in chromosome partitioning or flagellar assembly
MAKIVSIHSFRGGTGKSNLTANLAATVALQGLRVGIMDTDIQSPGIHVLFGLDEGNMNRSLNDYLWNRCPITEAAYNVTPEAVSKSNGSIYLIPSSIKAGEIARILNEGYSVTMLNDGVRQICQGLELDYLFIDTHPGLNKETLLSIAISDALIIILRPDRQDFQGTAVTLQVARKLDTAQMSLVINKMLPSYDRQAMQEQIEQKFKVPVIGMFPLNEEMVQLSSSGIFCLEFLNHGYTYEVRKVAQQLLG